MMQDHCAATVDSRPFIQQDNLHASPSGVQECGRNAVIKMLWFHVSDVPSLNALQMRALLWIKQVIDHYR